MLGSVRPWFITHQDSRISSKGSAESALPRRPEESLKRWKKRARPLTDLSRGQLCGPGNSTTPGTQPGKLW